MLRRPDSRSSIRHTAALAALGVLMTACGGGGSDSSTTKAPVDADVTIIGIDGIAWNAKTYEAVATDGVVTVLGENDSTLPHNLHLVDAEGTEVAGGIDLPRRGDSAAQDFRIEAGEYTVICKIAGHDNMKATLVVK